MNGQMARLGLGVILAAILVITGCATMGESDQDAFHAVVEQTWEKYSAAINAGDADAWITLWDENGVQMPPDTPWRTGKQAIDAAHRQGSALQDFTIYLDETVAAGGYGYARGTYSFVIPASADSPRLKFEGKYLTIYKRQADGSWKIYRDCFNFNGPPM
jgi:ketosteroid isomerase-like protein